MFLLLPWTNKGICRTLQNRGGALLKPLNRCHIPSSHVSQVTSKVLKLEVFRKGVLWSSRFEELGSHDKQWLLTLGPQGVRQVAQRCGPLSARGRQALMMEGSSRRPHGEGAKHLNSSTEQGWQLRTAFPLLRSFCKSVKGRGRNILKLWWRWQ